MSVSSHLNPEPERRLWIIHGGVRRALEWTEIKLWALTAFAAAQLALLKIISPEGAVSYWETVLLAAVLPIGLAALSPFIEAARQLSWLDPNMDTRSPGDSLIVAHDIAKYPQIELVVRLDKYLGGGVTATPYYEDIVGQIVIGARIAVRKHRLFLAACVPAGLVQLGLLWQFLSR